MEAAGGRSERPRRTTSASHLPRGFRGRPGLKAADYMDSAPLSPC
jgi:hypothetical protein